MAPVSFEASKEFNGQRVGMESKMGEKGLGYLATRPVAISFANELAIPETTHHPVTLELQKLFPADDRDRESLIAQQKNSREEPDTTSQETR